MAMTFKNWIASGLLACLCATMFVSTNAVASEEDAVAVINSFIEQIDEYKDLDKEKATELKKLVGQLRDDEYDRTAAITEALAVVYPEFATALEKLASEDIKDGMKSLTDLAKSDDQFLAAESSYFLARAAMFDQEFEVAIPLLDRVLKEFEGKTVQTGSSLYFKGIAQANMLKNKEALESLESFVRDYPSAPERMKISAIQKMQIISTIEDGSLLDVYQRMNFSHTRLRTEKTGEVTKSEQDKIVDMLGKMIKEQEKKECQSCKNCKDGECDKPGEADKPGEGKGEGQGKSQNGNGSNNPDGVVKRSFSDGPASAWSKLRDRERDAAFSSIKEKFPARYQGMVEQYFKSFQTEAAN